MKIKIEKGKSGLWYATVEDCQDGSEEELYKGLFLAGPNLANVLDQISDVCKALKEVHGTIQVSAR